jgi:hypothetical protein
MRPGLAVLVAGMVLVGSTTGCSDDESPRTAAEPTETPTSTPSSAAPATEPTSTPASDQPAASGGTAGDPAVVTPATHLLEWTPVPGPASGTVTRSGPWTLTVNESGSRATIGGPDGDAVFTADGRQRISDGLIAGDWAAVVFQDVRETRPATAEIVHLGEATGDFTLDGSSDVPTTTGGSWALGEGRLVHPTIGPGGNYCLATVDLAEQSSERTWCAEKRHGFNGARITPEGTSLMTFDDRRPSCRTVVQLSGDDVVPFEGVEDCLGWEGVPTPGGAVWSVVPKPTRIEEAHYYAREGDEYFDLGPGTSGTLTWCAGATYFAQDPVHDGDPARLLRWTADRSLEVVYETRGRGPAFLTEPRCGDGRITVTAVAESGDEQVTTEIG